MNILEPHDSIAYLWLHHNIAKDKSLLKEVDLLYNM